MTTTIKFPQTAEQAIEHAVRDAMAEHMEAIQAAAREAARTAPIRIDHRHVDVAAGSAVDALGLVPSLLLRLRGQVEEDALPLSLRDTIDDALNSVAVDVSIEAQRARETELAEMSGTTEPKGSGD